MKKRSLSILVIITIFFAAFTLGLFLGRNYQKSPITVSVPAAMQTVPPETTVPAKEPKQETQAVSQRIEFTHHTA